MSNLWAQAAAFQLQQLAAEEDPQYYYHVSPKFMRPGTELKPQGKGWANFDESSGKHVYVTPHEDRTQHYDYLLWQQGHPTRHIYAVEPQGRLEEDPNDPEAFQTMDPVHVIERVDRFRNNPVYRSPSGHEWRRPGD